MSTGGKKRGSHRRVASSIVDINRNGEVARAEQVVCNQIAYVDVTGSHDR